MFLLRLILFASNDRGGIAADVPNNLIRIAALDPAPHGRAGVLRWRRTRLKRGKIRSHQAQPAALSQPQIRRNAASLCSRSSSARVIVADPRPPWPQTSAECWRGCARSRPRRRRASTKPSICSNASASTSGAMLPRQWPQLLVQYGKQGGLQEDCRMCSETEVSIHAGWFPIGLLP